MCAAYNAPTCTLHIPAGQNPVVWVFHYGLVRTERTCRKTDTLQLLVIISYLHVTRSSMPAAPTSSACLRCRSLDRMLGARAFCSSCHPISSLANEKRV